MFFEKILKLLYHYQQSTTNKIEGVDFVMDSDGKIVKTLIDKEVFDNECQSYSMPQFKIPTKLEIEFDQPWKKGEGFCGEITNINSVFGIPYTFQLLCSNPEIKSQMELELIIKDERKRDKNIYKSYKYPQMINNRCVDTFLLEILSGLGQYEWSEHCNQIISHKDYTLHIDDDIIRLIVDDNISTNISMKIWNINEIMSKNFPNCFVFYPTNIKYFYEKNGIDENQIDTDVKHFYAKIVDNNYFVLKIERNRTGNKLEVLSLGIVSVTDDKEIEEQIYQYNHLYDMDFIIIPDEIKRDEYVALYEYIQDIYKKKEFWVQLEKLDDIPLNNIPYNRKRAFGGFAENGESEFLNRILSGVSTFFLYQKVDLENRKNIVYLWDCSVKQIADGYEIRLSKELIEKGKQEFNVDTIYGEIVFQNKEYFDDSTEVYCAKISDKMGILMAIVEDENNVMGYVAFSETTFECKELSVFEDDNMNKGYRLELPGIAFVK